MFYKSSMFVYRGLHAIHYTRQIFTNHRNIISIRLKTEWAYSYPFFAAKQEHSLSNILEQAGAELTQAQVKLEAKDNVLIEVRS